MPDTSSAMPPVPCPDCHHPTEHDGEVFQCTSCRQAFAHPHGMDLPQWRQLWRAWTARRQIINLPDPDGTSYEGDPTWGAHVDYEDIIFACVNNGRPEVDGPIGDEPLPADVAEMYGLRLLAAAREARRLAAGSGSGED